MPAHRRRLPACRWSPARSRRPRSATCWSRRGPTASWSTAPRCAALVAGDPGPAPLHPARRPRVLGRGRRTHRPALTARHEHEGAAMRVALFLTCVNDALYPGTGQADVTLLERLGVEVDFPAGQTCCGQAHFNTGYRHETEPLVRRHGRGLRGLRRRGHPVRLLRGDGPRQLPAHRREGPAEGRGTASPRPRDAGAARLRADRVPRRRARRDGRRRVLPAHRHLPPVLPRAAHAGPRRPAAPAARGRQGPGAASSCPAPRSAAASAAPSP